MHAAEPQIATVPLCVDLDGTLVRTDTLHEALILLARRSPDRLLHLPFWLIRGKAHFKNQVATHAVIDPQCLPYRQTVIDMIAAARAEGRPTVLATASIDPVANAVARHSGLFDHVICTTATSNLAGVAKGDALAERFGERGFDYIGDQRADLPIFKRARRGFLVAGSARTKKSASAAGLAITFVDDKRAVMRSWIKAVRVHQWLKNLLVFVPVLAGQQITSRQAILSSALAFIAFSLTASAIYLINDLLDLESDRRHPRKSSRPFASGALPVAQGVIVAPVLLLAAAGIAVLLPPTFLAVLAIYLVATTAYSFRFKQQVIVDVVILAGLYTMRIIAGSAATGIAPSFWLLAFSMFTFLSLAMVKRYSELALLAESTALVGGRGYVARDLPVVMALGASSGMISVLVLAMYTQSPIIVVHYPRPEWLWALPPLMLYWIARIWMKAHRLEVHDDPVVFAMRDWQSLVVAALFGIALFMGSAEGWRL